MDELTQKQQQEVKKEVSKQVKEKEKDIELRLMRRLSNKTKKFGSEFKKHISTALIAAFGLVIALSWQTVIRKFIESLPKSGILLYHPYLAELYTAIVVTFVAVIAILLITRWTRKTEDP